MISQLWLFFKSARPFKQRWMKPACILLCGKKSFVADLVHQTRSQRASDTAVTPVPYYTFHSFWRMSHFELSLRLGLTKMFIHCVGLKLSQLCSIKNKPIVFIHKSFFYLEFLTMFGTILYLILYFTMVK